MNRRFGARSVAGKQDLNYLVCTARPWCDTTSLTACVAPSHRNAENANLGTACAVRDVASRAGVPAPARDLRRDSSRLPLSVVAFGCSFEPGRRWSGESRRATKGRLVAHHRGGRATKGATAQRDPPGRLATHDSGKHGQVDAAAPFGSRCARGAGRRLSRPPPPRSCPCAWLHRARRPRS
jgi:hypothetical protein